MAPQTTPQKSVLITGASNGQIGAALVVAFQQKDFLVFAAVRDPDTATDLAKLPRVHILKIDLTSAPSITSAVEYVETHTSGRGLDVLINSARVEFVMPVIDTSIEEGRRLFDVNIWGTLGMVKGFTPQLIQSKGTIVNLSSIGGLVNTPWLGIYASSQSALTLLGETLRLELSPFNIRVLTLVTGCVQSDIYTKPGDFKLPPKSIYERILSTIRDAAEGTLDPEMMPAEKYAERVLDDVLKGMSGKVYRGNVASVTRVMSWLPSMILDKLLSMKRGLDELAKYVNSLSHAKVD